ncbi:unnamed protein product [Lepeophtheirus salmonis]|uniref:(salmon louse) hypothetical protein n=1 Tax=Lepeophtheirus salmonis TaxID=72036 RepID=A0A7R8CWP3_LEPSM|nr:unnamed protein product [Lepeophtheirus salmonis]CAF2954765.1 unnamed protein product [Lepeophtheirus salmonis]
MVSEEKSSAEQPNFNRGDRVSASVRLRNNNKKEDQSKKKRNRHSGDFGFFSKAEPKSEMTTDSSDDEQDLKDWSYITFPNKDVDKPDVIESKVLKSSLETNGPKMTPIKVVTREVPGLLPLRPLSTVIGNVPGPASATNPGNKRLSGDFSGYGRSPKENNRRKSEVYSSASSGVVRVSHEEFEFKKHELALSAPLVEEEDDGSEIEIEEKSKVLTPKLSNKLLQSKIAAGLGRRSITSVNLNSNKKNSYRSALCKSQENLVKATAFNVDESLDKDKSTLKKGLLWQQRDKLFSRRTSRITEMGEFIFKIKCGEVEDVELLDKRGYLTICISLPRDGKVYLRKTDGIREWYSLLKECVRECKKRRKESGALFRKQITDSSSIENWLQARKKIGLQYSYSDSTPEISKIPSSSSPKTSSQPPFSSSEKQERMKKSDFEKGTLSPACPLIHPSFEFFFFFSSPQEIKRRNSGIKSSSNGGSGDSKKINRLSLMSDIELPDCCNQDLGIDLEKGIFLRKKYLIPGDAESNDSGNNSMNTNGSVGSTTSSSGSGSNRSEERLETHFENIDIRDRSSDVFKNRDLKGGRRRSTQHVPGLQITHV